MRLGWPVVGLLCLGLVACEPIGLAPISDAGWYRHLFRPAFYQVHAGDTLYSVAFRYDLDYRQLAYYNHLRPPYRIRKGQRLWLKKPQPSETSPAGLYQRQPNEFPRFDRERYPSHPYEGFHGQAAGSHEKIVSRSRASSVKFTWPAHGKVDKLFSPAQGKKGIDIIGHRGERVQASASGVVAYAGNGLIGYGNLIIIKHSNHYLTAYGYLAHANVKEGQQVHKGQVIGEMGRVDRKLWGVHFEIRNQGKPVNPLIYLKM